MKYNTSTRTDSFKICQRRMYKYFCHLSKLRLAPDDDVYRYFASNVFHDGEMLVRSLKLSEPLVEISFVNVHALDAATRNQTCKPSEIKRTDFKTKIKFQNVSSFICRGNGSFRKPVYHCSFIDIRNNNYFIEIIFEDGCRISEQKKIIIQFKSIWVEDITPRICKYFESENVVNEAIGYLLKPASYYAQKWKPA